ncbi:hypothetical protein GCM10016455_25010 [Aliiroseovarius zhejiangensis]|uniref:Transposase n=1 Tax=Aliiroseovarius zhejiangensis TaxID=1632025 RepID=A0ABQ3J572_9RHOB|nr:hypothetical protein GCM10016455_25010 [Aliiroseovarius zhejiangensis]
MPHAQRAIMRQEMRQAQLFVACRGEDQHIAGANPIRAVHNRHKVAARTERTPQKAAAFPPHPIG